MKKHSLYKPKKRVIPLNSRLWKKMREVVIARDKGLCQVCLKRGLTVVGTDVDHLNNNGDDNELTNLMLLCHECHSMKTAQDMGKQVSWGCDEQGKPLDPNHEWNMPKVIMKWYEKPECWDNEFARVCRGDFAKPYPPLGEVKNHEKLSDEEPHTQSHFYDRS